VEELYKFLDACSLPITSDGCFLAYKKVRWDYKDLYSNTMDNSIGQVVKMSRNEVDENSNRTCSHGLHCAAFGYMSAYGAQGTDEGSDKVIIVKVNPKDVVAIPVDYQNQKMRVCEYTVVDELPNDGSTELMSWVCNQREVGWIKNTVVELKKLTIAFLGFEVNSTTELREVKPITDLGWRSFLENVVSTFKLKNVDKFYSEFEESATIKQLLQFISNWTS